MLGTLGPGGRETGNSGVREKFGEDGNLSGPGQILKQVRILREEGDLTLQSSGEDFSIVNKLGCKFETKTPDKLAKGQVIISHSVGVKRHDKTNNPRTFE